ncbi:MAG: phosphoribosyltransferase family protein [Dehalococcoidia bacterium]|jgi:predicted phosphoribosyltransferase
MHIPTAEPIFENRFDAGSQLASNLVEYYNQPVIVLGIPNGGVAVALSIALSLNVELDLVISRKIPLPLSPEGGFGSVTDDGTIIFNEEAVKKAGLSQQQINYQVSKVRADIRDRSLLYHKDRPPLTVSGKTVIIVDDGLASGYTMRAAIESIRHRKPEKIIAAVPVGPQGAVEEVKRVADKVVTCTVGTSPQFYLSDYYRQWHEITDDEVLQCLREWRMRKFGPRINLTEKRQPAES